MANAFNCVPSGGEGREYVKEAQLKGEFDILGYYARLIGCFEVDQMLHAHEKSNFKDFFQCGGAGG